MTITANEINESARLTFDDRGDVRVREFMIVSDDPATDNLWTEADAVRVIAQDEANISLPRIDDNWQSHGYSTGLPYNLSQPEIHDLTAGLAPMTMRSGRIIHVAVGGNRTAFKYVCQYSTEVNGWELHRSFEVSAKSETIHIDLDALAPGDGVSPISSEFNCQTYESIIQGVTDPTQKANLALIRSGKGADVLAPQLTLTYRRIVYSQSTDLIISYSDLMYTTNAEDMGPDMVADRWLFSGMAGGEVKDDVYDITLKFTYDDNFHRAFYYKTDPSTNNDAPVIDTQTGKPICRSYRVYRRKNWNAVLASFFN